MSQEMQQNDAGASVPQSKHLTSSFQPLLDITGRAGQLVEKEDPRKWKKGCVWICQKTHNVLVNEFASAVVLLCPATTNECFTCLPPPTVLSKHSAPEENFGFSKSLTSSSEGGGGGGGGEDDLGWCSALPRCPLEDN